MRLGIIFILVILYLCLPPKHFNYKQQKNESSAEEEFSVFHIRLFLSLYCMIKLFFANILISKVLKLQECFFWLLIMLIPGWPLDFHALFVFNSLWVIIIIYFFICLAEPRGLPMKQGERIASFRRFQWGHHFHATDLHLCSCLFRC